MFKKIAFFVLAGGMLASCSNDDSTLKNPEIVNPEVGNPIIEGQLKSLKVVSNLGEQNILNMVVFKLQDSSASGNIKFLALADKLKSNLDSLTWEIKGGATKMQLLQKQGDSYSVRLEWGHHFYLPGTYTTYLKAYKDGLVVAKDSTSTRVYVDGDFLNIQWNKPDGNFNMNTGFINNGNEDYSFSLLTNNRDGILSSILNVRFDDEVYEGNLDDLANRELEVLTNYMTTLYGDAKYQQTSESSFIEYNKLFKRTVQQDQVLKIWVGKTSNIVLLKKATWAEYGHGYEIYAEPKY